jgi:hypothetical protein
MADSLTSEWRKAIAAVLASEAEWLLQSYPVKAGLIEDNKPESNIWNGLLLLRAACWNPSATHADAWREKGLVFLVNGLSIPSDATRDEIVDGRPVRDRFVGAYFFETFACNHHQYLNMGYMVICLSNLALFHFSCREAGVPPPALLYRHVPELWNLVKACHFPDGRLLRIGGDTRFRYAYCQEYALPAWLFIRDHLSDPATETFERGWLREVQIEQNANGDGSFPGRRLAQLTRVSPLYRLRLEGDRAAAFSMAAFWKRVFPDLVQPRPTTTIPPRVLSSWHDDYHGAVFVKGRRRFTSWVWEAAEKPVGLCLPPSASSMAEWSHNLAGRILGLGRVNLHRILTRTVCPLPGGFATAGRFATRTEAFIAEGEEPDEIALTDVAFVALPDDATALLWQRARMRHRAYLRDFQSLHLVIPNDLWNRGTREYAWKGKRLRLTTCPGRAACVRIPSRHLVVDNRLSLQILHGANGFVIVRPPDRQIGLAEGSGRPQTSLAGGALYADEITLHPPCGVRLFEAHTLLFDIGVALICGSDTCRGPSSGPTLAAQLPMRVPNTDARAVAIKDQDGTWYGAAVAFSDSPASLSLRLPAGFHACHNLITGRDEPSSGRELSVHLDP